MSGYFVVSLLAAVAGFFAYGWVKWVLREARASRWQRLRRMKQRRIERWEERLW